MSSRQRTVPKQQTGAPRPHPSCTIDPPDRAIRVKSAAATTDQIKPGKMTVSPPTGGKASKQRRWSTNRSSAMTSEQWTCYRTAWRNAPFQRNDTAKIRELADPALVRQMDWWLEQTPKFMLRNLVNPFKFVPYGFRGWMIIRVASREGKLRPMMPLERYLLGLTVLLFVAYIATVTSGVRSGVLGEGGALDMKDHYSGRLSPMPFDEGRFALKQITNSLFGWNFVFMIPLGMIEQSEPRFLAANLPVAFVALWWIDLMPLERTNLRSVDAVGRYVGLAYATWVSGWFMAFITAHVCALRMRLSKKLPAYARQLLPKMLLLLGYLLLSAMKCWLGDESKRAGLAFAQTMVLAWAVMGGLTTGTLFERKLGWAHALSLDLIAGVKALGRPA
jgi:hypothetical protein